MSLFSTQLFLSNKEFSTSEIDLDSVTSGLLFPRIVAGKMASLHDYMTIEELNDANSNTPQLDHSEALKRALQSTSFLYFPAVKGAYRFKDIELPDGVWLVGNAKLSYMGGDPLKIIGCGSAIIMSDGGKCIFSFNNNVTLFGLVL